MTLKLYKILNTIKAQKVSMIPFIFFLKLFYTDLFEKPLSMYFARSYHLVIEKTFAEMTNIVGSKPFLFV
jgi:hypothetical protein